jgi:hypothetical protein
MPTSKILTTDRFVTHHSTVPANLGQPVGLFLREKVLEENVLAQPKKSYSWFMVVLHLP